MRIAAAVELERNMPELTGFLRDDWERVGAHLAAGQRVIEGLGSREERMAVQRSLRGCRAEFLRRHAQSVYGQLTDGFQREVRVEELVFAAAELFPGLVPSEAAIAAERRLPQSQKGPRAYRVRRA